MEALPLVSICLKSYNQKDFILAALDGVLSQTYRPLEVVVCDDGSTDGTWEILQDKLAAFPASASFSLVLHRNERNLGNCRNWEMCGKLAHGELLVKADGDDVSLPNRVERIVAAWIADGRRAKVISHGCVKIDEKGSEIGFRDNVDYKNNVLGACMTWSRDCFANWPDLEPSTAYDDEVYSFRARMLGTELYIAERLVKYRIGSGDTSISNQYRRPLLNCNRGCVDAVRIGRRDLASRGAHGPESAADLECDLDRRGRIHGAWVEILSGPRLPRRIKAVHEIWSNHGLSGRVLIVLMVLPWHLGDPIANWLTFRRKGRQKHGK